MSQIKVIDGPPFTVCVCGAGKYMGDHHHRRCDGYASITAKPINADPKLREEIARIIDPVPWKWGDADLTEAWKHRRQPSLNQADAILNLPALNQDRLASAEKAMREIIECEPKGWMAHAQAIVAKHFATYPESKT